MRRSNDAPDIEGFSQSVSFRGLEFGESRGDWCKQYHEVNPQQQLPLPQNWSVLFFECSRPILLYPILQSRILQSAAASHRLFHPGDHWVQYREGQRVCLDDPKPQHRICRPMHDGIPPAENPDIPDCFVPRHDSDLPFLRFLISDLPLRSRHNPLIAPYHKVLKLDSGRLPEHEAEPHGES